MKLNIQSRDLDRIRKIHPSQYYEVSNDKFALNDDNQFVKLTQEGMKLIIEFYQDKYKIKIHLYPLDVSKGVFSLESIIQFIHSVRNEEGSFRHAFILSTSFDGLHLHSIPLVYVKEKNKEAIVVLDSLGSIGEAKLLHNATHIKTFSVNRPRQRDGYSCHADALAILRDIMFIENLIDLLEERCVEEDGIFIIKLFNVLLKTAQSKEFIDLNKETDSTKIIHQNLNKKTQETLDQFLLNRPETMKLRGEERPSSYLRKKGLQYAGIIEIQYYLNELKLILKEALDEPLRQQFLKEAKEVLLAQGRIENRLGLYHFTREFLRERSLLNAEQADKKRKTSDVENETAASLVRSTKKR